MTHHGGEYISGREAQGSPSSSTLSFSQLEEGSGREPHYNSSSQGKKEEDGRLCLLICSSHPAPPLALLARLRLRPLRAPLPSLLPHLVAHPRRRFLRVRQSGRVLRRRHAHRGGAGAVQERRGLRRVLPGAVQGQRALRHGRRQGRGDGPRQDEVERHRPGAGQPGGRRHSPARHGRAAREARRRRRGVQEGAVRVQRKEPVGAGGGAEPRAQRAGRDLPLPGRPDRHRRRRRRAGWFVELEVPDAGARPGVEHEAGAGGAAAAPDRGDGRVRREVGVGGAGGPAAPVARRRGVRHGRPDHGHRPGGVLPLRHAGVEVRPRDRSRSPSEQHLLHADAACSVAFRNDIPRSMTNRWRRASSIGSVTISFQIGWWRD